MEPAKPRFSVVVPVLNGRATIRACLDAILEAIARWGPAGLTVVDNGSTDGTHELLLAHYGSQATLVRAARANGRGSPKSGPPPATRATF